MANRAPIKREHERFHVQNFLEWVNWAYRTDYRVVDEPDPPEAVIQSSRRTSWIEVTTAFLNSDFAQHVMSSVTPGEVHRSISGQLIAEPDEQFARMFVDCVRKKLEKKAYLPICRKYGPGYLIVPIHNPLFGVDSLRLMRRTWNETEINDLGCFRSVRIAYRGEEGWRLRRWSRERHPSQQNKGHGAK